MVLVSLLKHYSDFFQGQRTKVRETLSIILLSIKKIWCSCYDRPLQNLYSFRFLKPCKERFRTFLYLYPLPPLQFPDQLLRQIFLALWHLRVILDSSLPLSGKVISVFLPDTFCIYIFIYCQSYHASSGPGPLTAGQWESLASLWEGSPSDPSRSLCRSRIKSPRCLPSASKPPCLPHLPLFSSQTIAPAKIRCFPPDMPPEQIHLELFLHLSLSSCCYHLPERGPACVDSKKLSPLLKPCLHGEAVSWCGRCDLSPLTSLPLPPDLPLACSTHSLAYSAFCAVRL